MYNININIYVYINNTHTLCIMAVLPTTYLCVCVCERAQPTLGSGCIYRRTKNREKDLFVDLNAQTIGVIDSTPAWRGGGDGGGSFRARDKLNGNKSEENGASA